MTATRLMVMDVTPTVLWKLAAIISSILSIVGTSTSPVAEQCDDGNTAVGDGCSDECVIEVCGDGTVNASIVGTSSVPVTEACDDGNTVSGDGCSSECLIEGCGDGIVGGTEECVTVTSLAVMVVMRPANLKFAVMVFKTSAKNATMETSLAVMDVQISALSKPVATACSTHHE